MQATNTKATTSNEVVNQVVDDTSTPVMNKQRKPKATKMVQNTLKDGTLPDILAQSSNSGVKVDTGAVVKDKTEKMPALVSYYSKLKEKSNVSASEHKKLQDLYDKTFPNSLIRMKSELYSQLNKKSKGKTVWFEDARLGSLHKIPGQFPEMRYIIKYLNTKYTEESIGSKSLVTDIVVKYESPMNDVTILAFNWSE